MGLISLHRKYSFVDYQHHLCSFASLITFLAIIVAIIIPIIGIIRLNSAQNYFVVYEQPNVKFSYKYLVICENSMESESRKEILCSSFDFLRQFANDTESCRKIKVAEKDTNFDGITDEIVFTINFHTFHNYGIKSASIVLFLDARIYDQCEMRIPTAIILNKKFNGNFNDRKILIDGKLEAVQNQKLLCPFFLRQIKSHFFYENLNENQTNFEEFEIKAIQERLENNPAFFKFQETSTDYSRLMNDNDKTSIRVRVKIPEIPIRYGKTFWQKVIDKWIQFLSLFIVTGTILNFFLNHLFENRWIMARRKNYVKDKEF